MPKPPMAVWAKMIVLAIVLFALLSMDFASLTLSSLVLGNLCCWFLSHPLTS